MIPFLTIRKLGSAQATTTTMDLFPLAPFTTPPHHAAFVIFSSTSFKLLSFFSTFTAAPPLYFVLFENWKENRFSTRKSNEKKKKNFFFVLNYLTSWTRLVACLLALNQLSLPRFASSSFFFVFLRKEASPKSWKMRFCHLLGVWVSSTKFSRKWELGVVVNIV